MSRWYFYFYWLANLTATTIIVIQEMQNAHFEQIIGILPPILDIVGYMLHATVPLSKYRKIIPVLCGAEILAMLVHNSHVYNITCYLCYVNLHSRCVHLIERRLVKYVCNILLTVCICFKVYFYYEFGILTSIGIGIHIFGLYNLTNDLILTMDQYHDDYVLAFNQLQKFRCELQNTIHSIPLILAFQIDNRIYYTKQYLDYSKLLPSDFNAIQYQYNQQKYGSKNNYFFKLASAMPLKLVSSIVHELRTPTNSIYASLQMIEPSITQQEKKYVRTAQISCNLLINIINDLLDLSKLEDGKLIVNSLPFDVIKVVKESVSMISYSVEQKGLILEIDNKIRSLHIVGDERRFTQVLLNLLSNAIKFTQQGKITVILELNKESLYVSVEDTGIGIKDEDKAQIFKPFSQLENTISVNQNGTGLGLYVSKELCNKMNGDLTFMSEYNVKTKFTISLFQIKKVIDQSPEGECQIIRRKRKPKVEHKVLIVDDNSFNLMAISSLLTKQGIVCSTCTSGNKALEECQGVVANKQPFYKLILMDIEMPAMDGYEVHCSIDYQTVEGVNDFREDSRS